MVWPCKQNASEKVSQTSFTCESKRKKAVGRPRTRYQDYIEDLGWNRLGLQPSEMLAVMAHRDVWRLNLELLPRNPHGHERALKEEICERIQRHCNNKGSGRFSYSDCNAFTSRTAFPCPFLARPHPFLFILHLS